MQVKKEKEESVVGDESSDNEDPRIDKPSERNLVSEKIGDKSKQGNVGTNLGAIGIRNGSQVTGAKIAQNINPGASQNKPNAMGGAGNINNQNNIRQEVKPNGDKKI